MVELRNIYKPIEGELERVNDLIKNSIKKSKEKRIENIVSFLLQSPGKKLRPALVILSAKSTLSPEPIAHSPQPTTHNPNLIKIASCVELIHMASLLHDDVIDHSLMRHNKPTVNSKWGKDVAIALGDYLYSVGFELISQCGNPDIINCISTATKVMCEGELVQVCERDNLSLLKEQYFIIVKKKTASLFAASCQSGALISKSPRQFYKALTAYGLNFGIAFQIVDDYLDLAGEEKRLGKKPGQDIGVGELTLPVLNLLESVPVKKRKYLRELLDSKKNIKDIKMIFFDSGAAAKTEKAISSYIDLAKENLDILPQSIYRENLLSMADFIRARF